MKNQRYILLAFVLIAISVGAASRGLVVPFMARLELPDPQILGLVEASSFGALLIGVATFVTLLRSTAAVAYTDETITELRRVTWPTREDSVRSTTIVIGTTLFLAFALAGFDFVWGRITSAFLFTEG